MLVSIDLLSGKFMSGAYLKLNILKVEKNINSIKHWLKTYILCLQSELKSSKNQTQLICFSINDNWRTWKHIINRWIKTLLWSTHNHNWAIEILP